MNRRTLVIGAALLLATACGTTNATSPTTTTVTRVAPAAATMSPADMATMGHPTATPAPTVATAVQATAAAAATDAPAVTAAPAATDAPAVTTAPAPTTGPTAIPAPVTTPTPVATPAAPPPGTTVAVTLVDMAVRLSIASVPAGTVTFSVTNGGTTSHEFVVLQTSIAQSALAPDPANPGTVLEPGFLGKVPNLAPRATGSLTLVLGPGSYIVLCNDPAHYSALGMHAAFSVR